VRSERDGITFDSKAEANAYTVSNKPGTAELLVTNRNGATKDVTVEASMRKFKLWEWTQG
jgi:hypothetical protein